MVSTDVMWRRGIQVAAVFASAAFLLAGCRVQETTQRETTRLGARPRLLALEEVMWVMGSETGPSEARLRVLEAAGGERVARMPVEAAYAPRAPFTPLAHTESPRRALDMVLGPPRRYVVPKPALPPLEETAKTSSPRSAAPTN